MSIILPVGTDFLNSPSHSFLHRVVSVDSLSPASSIHVDGSGYVGINTTTPTARFQVVGDFDILGTGGAEIYFQDGSMTLITPNNSGVSAINIVMVGTTTGGNPISISSNSNIANHADIYLSNSGTTGIGIDVQTAYRAARLHGTLADVEFVAGKLLSGVSDGASAVGFTLNTTNALTTTAKLLSLKNNSVEKFAIDKDGNITTVGTVSGYVPYTGATTNVDLGSKTFTTTGNVGIGGAPGSLALTVTGQSVFSQVAYFFGSLKARYDIANDYDTYLTISGGSSGYTYFNGSIGIHESAPGAMLHVNLPTPVTATDNALLISRWTRPTTGGVKNGNTFDLLLGAYGNGINSQTRVDIKLAEGYTTTPDTTVMTWLSSGFVGINKTAPTVALDVVGAGAFTTTISASNINTKNFSVAVPTTPTNAIEFCTVTNTNFSANVEIFLTIDVSGYAQSKRYIVPCQFNSTAGVWKKCLPISSTGPYSGGTTDDTDVEVSITNSIATFRIRRVTGTDAGTANITVMIGGDMAGTTVAAASATYTSVTQPGNYDPTTLTMINGITNISGLIGTGTGTFLSSVADGASVKGFTFTTPAYSTAGAKVFSVMNGAYESMSQDQNGKVTITERASGTNVVFTVNNYNNQPILSVTSTTGAVGMIHVTARELEWTPQSQFYQYMTVTGYGTFDTEIGGLIHSYGGRPVAIPGVLFTQVNSVTVTAATLTTLMGTAPTHTGYTTAQQATMPANFLKLGKTMRITMRGRTGALALATEQWVVKFGSTTIVDSGAVGVAGALTGAGFCLELLVTVQTAGASGKLFVQGDVYYDLGGISYSIPLTTAAQVSFDCTASALIDIQMAYGATNAANTTTSDNCVIEVLN